MTYGKLTWHAPLERTIHSHMRLRDVSSGANLVRFDITLANADGDVLAEIENFAIVKVDGGTFAEPDATGALAAVGEVSSPEVMFQRFLEAGLDPDEGWQAFERVMERGAGHAHVFVSPLPIQGQVDLIDATLGSSGDDDGTKFARPNLASEYREATDEVERGLVQLWEELLGVDPIGVDDDFFELGGHSLIALRLFASIKQRFGVDQPMSILFDASTVAKLSEFIRADIGGGVELTSHEGEVSASTTASMRHVVQMSPDPGDGAAPFFLVAGMFGNILNLRHLAMLIGEDRAVYGIQARGLRGGEEPHDRFEDMAEAYLEEIRQVQPEGPYYLGGFSGGGMTAYEMAQQLTAVGEEVAMVVMLDTPVPGLGGELSRADKVLMQLQRIQRMKHKWVPWYLETKVAMRERAQQIEAAELAEHEFRTEAITEAFIRAVASYQPEPWDGDLHIYRPKLNEEFRVTGARYIDQQFNFQVADNGWTPYVRDLTVREVPGDHDSMVLEPNVRVLAAHVIADIAAVEAARSEAQVTPAAG